MLNTASLALRNFARASLFVGTGLSGLANLFALFGAAMNFVQSSSYSSRCFLEFRIGKASCCGRG